MKYKIPRYIDYKAKIFGPANFVQFLYFLAGMILIGFLWLIIENFLLFVAVSILIAGISGTLAFGKINGQPIPKMIGKYIVFQISGSKKYIWKKKELAPKVIKRKEKKKKEEENENELPMSKKRGRLDKISKKIEIS